jgi:NADPH-dependent curcumin reductase CurA
VVDYAERFAEGREELAQWLTQGKLSYREDIVRGIENAPQAFIGMLQGKNLGKQLVQITEV